MQAGEPDAKFGPHEVPDLRTLQRWVRDDRDADKSGAWRVSMTAPEDVPRIFASIEAAIEASGARIRWVSAKEAEWIVRVSKLGERVALTPGEVFGAARQLARSDARDPSDHLEDFKLGMAAGMLDSVLDLGTAKDLREWIDRGPRPWVTATGGSRTHKVTH